MFDKVLNTPTVTHKNKQTKLDKKTRYKLYKGN